MPRGRVDAVLITGGRFHDFDFARLELLKLLAEHEHVRVICAPDFADVDAIATSRFLVSYTCDVRPTENEQRAVANWVRGGGRWLALHGTNSALKFTREGVDTPRVFPTWAHTLGSQFVAHPPIQPYKVDVVAPEHPLVAGIDPFETDDELYLCEYHDMDQLVPLLQTQYSGRAEGFLAADWPGDEARLVMYLRPLGEGAVLYNTLGHCRGHYDMRPVMEYYPHVERGSWDQPAYYELLRRGIAWAMES